MAMDIAASKSFSERKLVYKTNSGLLVSSASTWVRLNETGYRQVVAHIPVVIYSARLLQRARVTSEERLATRPSPHALNDVEIVLVSAACWSVTGLSVSTVSDVLLAW